MAVRRDSAGARWASAALRELHLSVPGCFFFLIALNILGQVSASTWCRQSFWCRRAHVPCRTDVSRTLGKQQAPSSPFSDALIRCQLMGYLKPSDNEVKANGNGKKGKRKWRLIKRHLRYYYKVGKNVGVQVAYLFWKLARPVFLFLSASCNLNIWSQHHSGVVSLLFPAPVMWWQTSFTSFIQWRNEFI